MSKRINTLILIAIAVALAYQTYKLYQLSELVEQCPLP
jgi:hypothetical protein